MSKDANIMNRVTLHPSVQVQHTNEHVESQPSDATDEMNETKKTYRTLKLCKHLTLKI